MVNAQNYIEEKFSKDSKFIEAGNKELEGSLDLSKYTRLERLELWINKITFLNVSGCPNLWQINIDVNELTNLDLSKNKKIKALSISDNNFPEQDLSFLSHLTELEHLAIQNYYREIGSPFSNKFKGSLESLKNAKIKELFIANTNVSKGLEYLPHFERFLVSTGQDLNINKSFYNFTNDKQRDYLQGYIQIFNNLQKFACESKQRSQQLQVELTNWQTKYQEKQKELVEKESQLKQQNNQLQSQLNKITLVNLTNQHKEVEQRLGSLIKETQQSLGEIYQDSLETLLEAQKEVNQNNSTFANRQLAKAKSKLETKLGKEKLQTLCEIQNKVVDLEQQLKELQIQDQQLQAQIIVAPPAYRQ